MIWAIAYYGGTTFVSTFILRELFEPHPNRVGQLLFQDLADDEVYSKLKRRVCMMACLVALYSVMTITVELVLGIQK